MDLFYSALIFVLGTAVGSFLSVVVYRLHTGEKGMIRGRSQCPACKTKLKWFHLIPIFSWIFLRGRCSDCGKKISSHYIVMEFVTGLIFLFTFLNWNFIDQFNAIDWTTLQTFILYIVEATFLLAIFFYDLMYKEIPDRLSIPAIAIAIIGVLSLQILRWDNMLIGAAVIGGFFLLQFIASKGRWIGGGDIRLGVLMGALLGWKLGLTALAIAYIIGGIFSLFLLLKRKISKNSEIAFGPFLVTGTFIALFYGQAILDWYLNFTILY